jgi:hypothetical protein
MAKPRQKKYQNRPQKNFLQKIYSDFFLQSGVGRTVRLGLRNRGGPNVQKCVLTFVEGKSSFTSKSL